MEDWYVIQIVTESGPEMAIDYTYPDDGPAAIACLAIVAGPLTYEEAVRQSPILAAAHGIPEYDGRAAGTPRLTERAEEGIS